MKKNGRKIGGLSIRVFHLLMVIFALAIAGMLGFSAYRSSNVFASLSKATSNYIVRQEAAHSLMEASDYLTEMAQRFTLEGDITYLNNYFEEAFVSKRREASILAMTDNEAEENIVNQLEEAMNESQTLMYREYYAMKLVVEALEIRDYPDTLQAIELSEEDVFLSKEEKLSLAQELVMGSEYYASKAVIRNNLKTSLETIDEMMNFARQDSSAKMMQELFQNRILIMVLVAAFVGLIVLIMAGSTIPLLRAAKSLKAKEPIPSTGTKEFRLLAEAYNELAGFTSQEEEE